MPKVKGPLFSEAASGDLAGAIQFVCGHYVRKKPEVNDAESSDQLTQRNKFLDGASYWSNDLTNTVKSNWLEFKKVVEHSEQCTDMPMELSGYNLWMLFWLKFGEGGWDDFPDPPGF